MGGKCQREPRRTRARVVCPGHAALAIAWLVVAAVPPALVRAQVEAGSASIAFDIPEQPLDSALARYFRVTGVQLLYDSAITAGRSSAALRGRYPPREALRLMLAGTGLRVRYSKSNAAIILSGVAAGPSSLIPLGRVVVHGRAAPHRASPIERIAYYDRLERALQARLLAAPATARLAFRITLRMEIDTGGTITALRVDRGTGPARSDALITQALRTGPVPPPPPGLEQPLLIALRGTRRD